MEHWVTSNGVNPDTGEYLIDVGVEELAGLIRGDPPVAPEPDYIDHWNFAARSAAFGLAFDVDPTDPAQAGWGVVVHQDEDPSHLKALEPLLEHRSRQVPQDRFHVLDVRAGESFLDWLGRHDVNPGRVDPLRAPYYLMLIGAPERIPFEFQYLLDVEYAVGRLDLDRAECYEQYAGSVVEYETASTSLRDPTAAFFGTNHPWDARATGRSASELVAPLATGQNGQPPALEVRALHPTGILGEAATRQNLLSLLRGDLEPVGRPALLLTATHGIGDVAPSEPERQRRTHGALVCQDWPGGPVDVDQVTVVGDHISDVNVHGLISFFFACYGAGTPSFDEFPGGAGAGDLNRATIAPAPFVAQLPKAMLAQPRGGALAVMGHIERTFTTSIAGRGGGQLQMYENLLAQIAVGLPCGHAMRDFNEKYASLAANLITELRDIEYGKKVPAWELAGLWLELHDARNFVLLGDPAARTRPHS